MGRNYASPYRQFYVKKENRVPSCASCNTRKGGKDPLNWLSSPKLPDIGASRLRDHLILLGLDEESVEAAWKAREAALENRRMQREKKRLVSTWKAMRV